MTINEILNKIKYFDLDSINYNIKRLNKILIPINKLDEEDFNTVVQYLNQLYDCNKINRSLDFTSSGGIQTKNNKNLYNTYSLDFKTSASGEVTGAAIVCIITDTDESVRAFRAVLSHKTLFNSKELNSDNITGTKAYQIFKRVLRRYKVFIEDFAIANGEEVKSQIEVPMIELYCEDGRSYRNSYHFDINSSFPSAMVEYHPEWKEAVEEMYNNRKSNPVYKKVLNASYGYFQSKFCNIDGHKYALADVSKYCLKRNNEKIREMIKKLEATGAKILATNTDGIWFQASNDGWQDLINLNSTKLGEFKLDHKNVVIRFKSKGSYEYIENDTYTPVVRGSTLLDKELDRSDWTWGSIYGMEATPVKYSIISDKENKDYGMVLKKW